MWSSQVKTQREYNISNMTTKQANTGRGGNRNPEGKGGFGDNPQNRSDGRWKKENSISYNYNLFLAMSEEEFAEFIPKTKAQRIAYNRIKDAEDSLNDTKEITDRIEGKAPQSVDVTTGGEPMRALVEFKGE